MRSSADIVELAKGSGRYCYRRFRAVLRAQATALHFKVELVRAIQTGEYYLSSSHG
jgi:hypothetical protein